MSQDSSAPSLASLGSSFGVQNVTAQQAVQLVLVLAILVGMGALVLQAYHYYRTSNPGAAPAGPVSEPPQSPSCEKDQALVVPHPPARHSLDCLREFPSATTSAFVQPSPSTLSSELSDGANGLVKWLHETMSSPGGPQFDLPQAGADGLHQRRLQQSQVALARALESIANMSSGTPTHKKDPGQRRPSALYGQLRAGRATPFRQSGFDSGPSSSPATVPVSMLLSHAVGDLRHTARMCHSYPSSPQQQTPAQLAFSFSPAFPAIPEARTPVAHSHTHPAPSPAGPSHPSPSNSDKQD